MLSRISMARPQRQAGSPTLECEFDLEHEGLGRVLTSKILDSCYSVLVDYFTSA